MSVIFWIIEVLNWLIYGSPYKQVFKVVKKKDYDWTKDDEWESCFHIQQSSNDGTELWITAMGYKPIFPEFLRKNYLLTWKHYR